MIVRLRWWRWKAASTARPAASASILSRSAVNGLDDSSSNISRITSAHMRNRAPIASALGSVDNDFSQFSLLASLDQNSHTSGTLAEISLQKGCLAPSHFALKRLFISCSCPMEKSDIELINAGNVSPSSASEI